ncbi:MAG: hypothetical protein NPIRA05_18110 [Nitrospirales bacterium]|nr:MAG: hypothetical protein NPIRA05_18110 [Nitrospirales bacterium]
MFRGKYLSLDEARKKSKQGKDKFDRFCKEHPSTGKKKTFDQLLNVMAKSPQTSEETSFQDSGAD